MLKIEEEELMAMVISWMSRINKAAAPNSKPNQKTEPEIEEKRDPTTTNS